MAGAGGNLIAARGLGKSFGALPVLRAIDLSVERGATVALVGSNGAGKSTLLKLLAGVMRPSRGALELFGVACYPERSTPNLLARVGYLGHDPLVYRDLTARENLEFFARLYDSAGSADTRPRPLAAVEARVADALVRAGLAATGDRPAHALSRGMLQRLALARATLHRPELLLLDEPFSGLDPDGSAHLESELAQARADGRTTVLVTHDLLLVARLADRAIVLAGGRVVLDLAPVPAASELVDAYRRASGEKPGRRGDDLPSDVGDRA